MSRKLLIAAACAAVVSSLAIVGMRGPVAMAAPEPAVVPMTWELTFKNQLPERIVVEGKTYWYVRYTVSNNTGRDVLYTPDFEITTDSGQAIAAYKDVPKDVFGKIKELHGATLLQSHTEILGKLLQGEDNAKDGVIIFAGLEAEARVLNLFISGISGETAEVKNPMSGAVVVLQKSLVLEYSIPGEAVRIDPRPTLKSTKWVMK